MPPHVKTAGWELENYTNGSFITENYTQGVHWTTTPKIGADDGRKLGGSSVVDLVAKVYGTNNLRYVPPPLTPLSYAFPRFFTYYTVIISIHSQWKYSSRPSLSQHPSYIMIVAEAAVTRILAL